MVVRWVPLLLLKFKVVCRFLFVFRLYHNISFNTWLKASHILRLLTRTVLTSNTVLDRTFVIFNYGNVRRQIHINSERMIVWMNECMNDWTNGHPSRNVWQTTIQRWLGLFPSFRFLQPIHSLWKRRKWLPRDMCSGNILQRSEMCSCRGCGLCFW